MKPMERFMNELKSFTKRQAAETILTLLPHVSEETFLKLALLAEKTVDGDTKDAIRVVIDHLHNGSDDPAVRIFRRVMTELSPHCLRKFSKTLFLNTLLASADTRDEFERKQGYRPPFALLLSPTMRCNLHCTGCYSGKYKQAIGLPYETLDRVIGEARGIGTRFIVLSGGEPLTRKEEIFSLISKYSDIYFMFYSNGTLIDDETARKMEECGNIGAVISLEGFEKSTDARRGTGTFQKIMEAFDHLKRYGIPFGTSVTVTRNNVTEVTSDAFYDMIIDKGVMVLWYFLFMPVGKNPDTSLMPTPEQREFLRQRDIYLRATKSIFIADFWNDAPTVGGCIAAGRNYLHINANGDVEPCVFAHYAVDNIEGKSLTDVLNSDFFKYIRSKQPYNENLLRPCQLIDNPQVWRDAVSRFHAYPTHQGAEDLVEKISGELDDYARRQGEISDEVWKTEFLPLQKKEEDHSDYRSDRREERPAGRAALHP